MHIKTFRGGYDNNFTYIIHNEKHAVIIDPAVSSKEVFQYIDEKKLIPKFVIVMHSHFDHLVQLDEYRRHYIPVYAHESMTIEKEVALKDNDQFTVDDMQFSVLHTPGHRFDSICILVNGKHLFTSDTLFVEGCGRIDFPGSEPEKMVQTLERLKQLPEDTIIYPGHDYGPTQTSTIGRENKRNRFLSMNKEQFLQERLG